MYGMSSFLATPLGFFEQFEIGNHVDRISINDSSNTILSSNFAIEAYQFDQSLCFSNIYIYILSIAADYGFLSVSRFMRMIRRRR